MSRPSFFPEEDEDSDLVIVNPRPPDKNKEEDDDYEKELGDQPPVSPSRRKRRPLRGEDGPGERDTKNLRFYKVSFKAGQTPWVGIFRKERSAAQEIDTLVSRMDAYTESRELREDALRSAMDINKHENELAGLRGDLERYIQGLEMGQADGLDAYILADYQALVTKTREEIAVLEGLILKLRAAQAAVLKTEKKNYDDYLAYWKKETFESINLNASNASEKFNARNMQLVLNQEDNTLREAARIATHSMNTVDQDAIMRSNKYQEGEIWVAVLVRYVDAGKREVEIPLAFLTLYWAKNRTVAFLDGVWRSVYGSLLAIKLEDKGERRVFSRPDPRTGRRVQKDTLFARGIAFYLASYAISRSENVRYMFVTALTPTYKWITEGLKKEVYTEKSKIKTGYKTFLTVFNNKDDFSRQLWKYTTNARVQRMERGGLLVDQTVTDYVRWDYEARGVVIIDKDRSQDTLLNYWKGRKELYFLVEPRAEASCRVCGRVAYIEEGDIGFCGYECYDEFHSTLGCH